MRTDARNALSMALVMGLVVLGVSGCGGPQVSYEETGDVETVDEGFGPTDVQMMAEEMINDLNSWDFEGYPPPVVGSKYLLLLSRVRNKTHEHIDMKNVMNSIKTGLIRGRLFRFAADKERRSEHLEEVQFDESGAVDSRYAKKFGRLVGADVFLHGELTDIRKQNDDVKLVHFKLTLILDHIETGETIWINEKEIRKLKTR